VVGFLIIILLQISICQWKKCENRLRFDAVTAVSLVSPFLWNAVYIETHKLSPRDRRDDMSPADGSSTHSGSTSVRGRVRSPHVTKLQAARVHAYSLGQLRHRRDRRTDSRTDGLRYRLISPYGGGIKIRSRLVLRPKF